MTRSYKLVIIASELALQLRRIIHLFPQDENYLHDIIRDDMFTVVEYVALASAGYHPIDQFRFFMRAKKHLENLRGHTVLCRAANLMSQGQCKDFDRLYGILRAKLIYQIEALQRAIQNLPPSSMW